jgi:hypothetical protein
MEGITLTLIIIGIIIGLAIIGCWWGGCFDYYVNQLRQILNNWSSPAIVNPPASPIAAIIRLSVLKDRQDTNDQ